MASQNRVPLAEALATMASFSVVSWDSACTILSMSYYEGRGQVLKAEYIKGRSSTHTWVKEASK